MLILNGDFLDLLNHFDHIIQDSMNLLMGKLFFVFEYFYSSVILLTVRKELIDDLNSRIIDEFPIFLLICEFFNPL
jgi:hypothetical protein